MVKSVERDNVFCHLSWQVRRNGYSTQTSTQSFNGGPRGTTIYVVNYTPDDFFKQYE